MKRIEKLIHSGALRRLLILICLVGLILAVWATAVGAAPAMPLIAKVFMILWLALAVVALVLIVPADFAAGFLIALLAFLVGWRLAGLYGLDRVSYPLIAVFVAFLALFFDTARRNLRSPRLGPAADPLRSPSGGTRRSPFEGCFLG